MKYFLNMHDAFLANSIRLVQHKHEILANLIESMEVINCIIILYDSHILILSSCIIADRRYP